MAAAVSISAYANVDLATSKYTTLSKDQMTVNTDFVVASSDNDMQKAPAKEAYAAENVLNTYLYHNINRSSGDDGGEHSLMLTVVMDGPQAGDSNGENCSLYGIFYGMQIRAVYNPTAGTIRVFPQPLFMNTYYNEMVWLYCQNAETDAVLPYIDMEYLRDGVKLTYTATGESFTVAENGFFTDLMNQFTITLPSLLGTNSGWAWKYQNWFDTVEIEYPSAYLNIDESEWNAIGNASFKDGWLQATVGQGESLGFYDVPCFQNKENKNLYMLKNPYGEGTPYYATNDLRLPGYIAFEVISEEVENWDGDLVEMTTIVVTPFVLSGYDNVETIEAPIYCTNLEGKYYYIFENTIEDMYYDFGDLDLELSTLGDDMRTITLPNCRIQAAGVDANITDQWVNNSQQPIPMESVIVLPVAVGDAGVEGIIDNSNAPVKYYNLQGVEVSNPEKGQILIKKQGNTTVKTIVR